MSPEPGALAQEAPLAKARGGIDEVSFRHIRSTHKVKKMSLKGRDLDKLKRLEYPRPTSPGHVKQMVEALQAGVSLKGVYVVNDISDGRGERYRLIDGNHRLEAHLKFAEVNPDVEFDLEFHVYDHASKEEELELFRIYNKRRNVTQWQIIGVARETIPIWAMMEEGFAKGKFPAKPLEVRATPKAEGVPFVGLCRAWLNRFNIYSHSARSGDEVGELRGLGEKDFKNIAEFLEDAIAATGRAALGNKWLQRSVVLATLAKFYACNVGEFGRKEVVKRLRKLMTDPTVMRELDLCNSGHLIKHFNEVLVKAANRGRQKEKYRFLTAEEFAEKMKTETGGAE